MQEIDDAPSHITEGVTTKQRAAVQREVQRLLDELAPERPPARHDAPVPTVRQHRFPGRCILQGTTRAVSVSWFPEGYDATSLGEMLVIAWRGVVSLPGSAHRAAGPAEVLTEVLLRPSEGATGEWEWHLAADHQVLSTSALASYCRELLLG
ncbi:MAG TPA: hypothetical protein VFS08_09635 [Gemmatimonadaceae bacterium]|nr:hypothetical protein [Gemmatimonadaceae bacterium]